MRDDANRHRHKPPADGGSGFGAQSVSLSLFLILLAFFIVLNASSSFDRVKMRPVIESLEETFASRAIGEDELPALLADPAKFRGMGETFDEIDGLLKSLAPGIKSERLNGNGVLFIRITENEWRRILGVGGTAHSGDEEFLARLSVLLMPQDKAIRFSTSIMIGLGDSPALLAIEKPETVDDAMKRADGYVRNFTRRGFPSSLVMTGLQAGKKGYVDLLFKLAPAAAQGDGEISTWSVDSEKQEAAE